ncbi:MAG: hypothetical protein M1814_001275 [Vezdaea aestivalis]|nr:MAG: hypothetical protein M1814_001275 [Vezdaea aestivalis]
MVSGFLRDLRRRSLASFKTDKSSSDSYPGDHVTTTQSSSTLSSSYGSTTPPSTVPAQRSSPSLLLSSDSNAPPVPLRPKSQYNRYSIMGSANPSPNGLVRPSSPYAPRILSITDNTWVHQKTLLIYGQVGDPAQYAMDGTVTVSHHQDGFPTLSWPVFDSHFKLLVHLTPGPNRLRFDFTAAKRPSNANPVSVHSTYMNINMLPLDSAPPLQLAILLGKDSPGTFDAVPERINREGNGLETAIRKYKMTAYLWQAFTAEQMYRNKFGRRAFRFEEEWQPGTLTCKDRETSQLRNEARIHIIRSEKTVAELQDLGIAQQYDQAHNKGELFSIAMNDVRNYFKPPPGQKQYVSVLLLDSHWDIEVQTIRGHAALGGGDGSIQLAICGSHALQSYPSCFEEVVPAFSDCTRTDTKYVANDCGESGSNWEAANIGIGAHLHETGHLFGCPHQESGVMLRDYVKLNRTFTCREPFSTRTKSPGQRLCLPKDECAWHRLDCLRFRYHPSFRVPTDISLNSDGSVQVWTVGHGSAMAMATTGIAWIEIFAEGDDVCRAFVDYSEGNGNGSNGPPQQVSLNDSDLRSRLPDKNRNKRMKLEIFSAGQGSHVIEDFKELVSKSATLKLSNGQPGFRGGKLGFSSLDGSSPHDLILDSAINQTKLLVGVRVYHGMALDGVEFIYEDFTRQLFGKKTDSSSDFNLDTRKGETLMGFYVRAGLWIDGIEILTSTGRRSGVFGNANGGSGQVS